MLLSFILYSALILSVAADCAFLINQTQWPYVPEGKEKQGFVIEQSLCKNWIGKQGCCNHNAYLQTLDNFKKIDTIFASSSSGGSGGCDLCSINLKRFWCQYACNPNQAEFAKVGNWVWVPSFDHPGEQVYVQQIVLTVQGQTACKLFESCKRTSYAAQLSALQSPAGFLNFQGTNALDAHQIIYIDFTDDKSKGLYVQDLDNCSVKLPTPPQQHRGFQVVSNCSCNTCESECSGQNFYQPTSVMQGFSFELVFWVWGVVIVSIVGITIFRFYRKKSKRD